MCCSVFFGGRLTLNVERLQLNAGYLDMFARRCIQFANSSEAREATDTRIHATIGKLDFALPVHIQFTILSNDQGYDELMRRPGMAEEDTPAQSMHRIIQRRELLQKLNPTSKRSLKTKSALAAKSSSRKNSPCIAKASFAFGRRSTRTRRQRSTKEAKEHANTLLVTKTDPAAAAAAAADEDKDVSLSISAQTREPTSSECKSEGDSRHTASPCASAQDSDPDQTSSPRKRRTRKLRKDQQRQQKQQQRKDQQEQQDQQESPD